MHFQITYKIRHIDLNNEFGDTKTEIILNSNGKVLARHWNHHGVNNHYCLIQRAKCTVDLESIKNLYVNLIDLINQNGQLLSSLDTDSEIILEQPGIKISINGSFSIDHKTCNSIIEEYLQSIHLDFKPINK